MFPVHRDNLLVLIFQQLELTTSRLRTNPFQLYHSAELVLWSVGKNRPAYDFSRLAKFTDDLNLSRNVTGIGDAAHASVELPCSRCCLLHPVAIQSF